MSEDPAKDISPLRLKRSSPAVGAVDGGKGSEKDREGEVRSAAAPLDSPDSVPSAPAPAPIKLRVGPKLLPPPAPKVEPEILPLPVEMQSDHMGAPLLPLGGAMALPPPVRPVPPPLLFTDLPPPLPPVRASGAEPPRFAASEPLPALPDLPPLPTLPPLTLLKPGTDRAMVLDPQRSSAAEKKPGLNIAPAKEGKGVYAFYLLVFLLIVGGGGFGYFYFKDSTPAEEPAAALKSAEEIAEAKQAAIARGAEQAAQAEAARIAAEAEAKRLAAETAAAAQAVKGSEANPPPVVGPPLPPVKPKANARFVKYAAELSVSGVFQGTPSRALVDGRVMREGELIEPALGVTFAGVDPQKKEIILEDKSGATVRVKY